VRLLLMPAWAISPFPLHLACFSRLNLPRLLCCRGIVVRESVSKASADRQPLIAVPEHLLLTTAAARERLGPVLSRASARRQGWWPVSQRQQEPPDPSLLLALLLAAERSKGPGSPWQPYIAALPSDIPCGWALSQDQLGAKLAALGSMAADWGPRVRAAADAVQGRVDAAAAAWGTELGVSAVDLRWALGHVVSRCFGSGELWLQLWQPCFVSVERRGSLWQPCLLGIVQAWPGGSRHNFFSTWDAGLPQSACAQGPTWRCCRSSTSATTGSMRPRLRGALCIIRRAWSACRPAAHAATPPSAS
jgi:hypothetical protein